MAAEPSYKHHQPMGAGYVAGEGRPRGCTFRSRCWYRGLSRGASCPVSRKAHRVALRARRGTNGPVSARRLDARRCPWGAARRPEAHGEPPRPARRARTGLTPAWSGQPGGHRRGIRQAVRTGFARHGRVCRSACRRSGLFPVIPVLAPRLVIVTGSAATGGGPAPAWHCSLVGRFPAVLRRPDAPARSGRSRARFTATAGPGRH